MALSDGRLAPASIISSTTSTRPYFQDYAILHVHGAGASPLRVGLYADVEVGEDLLVLGFPLGLNYLVAARAMAAAKARVDSIANTLAKTDVIELDGAVNVGNSGGPALSVERSEVVGIVSVRHGSIQDRIDNLREAVLGGAAESITMPILEILEESEDYLNPGIGRASSTESALEELRDLGIRL